MWRTIKLWWFLRLLESDCINASGDEIERTHVHCLYISEMGFLERAARKAVHPRKTYGVCTKCGEDKRSEIDKKYGKKVAKKMNEYGILLKLCKEKGYLDTWEKEDENTNKTTTLIHPSNKASEITGFVDLLETLLKQYKLTWTLIFVPIVTFLLGIHFGGR